MATGNKTPGILNHWFQDWHRPLRRFLMRRRLGTPADIDDIAQEVFLRLLRYDRADLVDHPPAYIFKIATNVSAEWSIRSNRRMPHNSEWLSELVDSLSPDIVLEQEAQHETVRKAVEALPDRARDILRLHFGEGMTNPQIAEALRLTRKVVKRDIERAYASLRATLEPDIFPSGSRRKTTT